jgi:transcriptional regulator with GAF, ATPase, and Fis domain
VAEEDAALAPAERERLAESSAVKAVDFLREAQAAGYFRAPQAVESAADPGEEPLGDGFSLARHLEEIQRHYLRRAMEEAGGVKRRAAELLGYRNYQTLAAQLERLGIR